MISISVYRILPDMDLNNINIEHIIVHKNVTFETVVNTYLKTYKTYKLKSIQIWSSDFKKITIWERRMKCENNIEEHPFIYAIFRARRFELLPTEKFDHNFVLLVNYE